jgi:hypothetical protein
LIKTTLLLIPLEIGVVVQEVSASVKELKVFITTTKFLSPQQSFYHNSKVFITTTKFLSPQQSFIATRHNLNR